MDNDDVTLASGAKFRLALVPGPLSGTPPLDSVPLAGGFSLWLHGSI